MENIEFIQGKKVSARDVARFLKEPYQLILNNKYKVIILGVIIFGLGLGYKLIKKPVYTSTATFMVNERTGGTTLSGLSRITSQLGLGRGAEQGIYAEKLVELVKSRHIIEDAFLTKVVIDDKEDYLANHYINIFNIDKEWDKSKQLHKGFRLTSTDKENFSFKENFVLSILYKSILKFIEAKSSMNGIVTLSYSGKSEIFCIQFIRKLIRRLSDFYVEKSIEQQVKTYNLVQDRTDSVLVRLKEAEFKLAKFEDESIGIVKAQGKLEQMDFARKVAVLNAIYMEGIRNLEISAFTLHDRTPVVQIIDRPYAPIEVEKVKTLNIILLCSFIWVFCTVLIIIYLKFSKNIIDAFKTEFTAQQKT